jgi:hypothetical protein
MISILFIIVTGHAMAFQEFNSMQACQRAERQIREMKIYVETTCVLKG